MLLNGNLHKSVERLDAFRGRFSVFLPPMKRIRVFFMFIGLAICPGLLHAQQADAAFLEFVNSIAQSKNADAATWSQQAKSASSKAFVDLVFQLRKAGFKSPQLAYLLARTFLQSNPNLQLELLSTVQKLIEQKDNKTLLALS